MSPKTKQLALKNRIVEALMGSAVGDAIGVPVEFSSRATRKKDPVKDMREFGTWNQKRGTWSDDTSMMLCLLDSLLSTGFDLEEQGIQYAEWLYEKKWTPHGRVFDCGGTCSSAIRRFQQGTRPSGISGEFANGNGSLMRTLPLSIWLAFKDVTPEEAYKLAGDASAITHAHPRSRLGCTLHAFFVRALILGDSKEEAHKAMRQDLEELLEARPDLKEAAKHYKHALDPEIGSKRVAGCRGDGYVVSCFQASIWAVMTSKSYEEAVLKAVNLGDDTDTTGCVTGGLAGLIFGAVPWEWEQVIARRDELDEIFNKFAEAL